MIRKFAFPAFLGCAGIAVLINLGVWQLQRLEWKAGVLAEISSRLHASPVALPANPSPDRHNYLAVTAVGMPIGEELLVLLSRKGYGPGFRSITAFATDDRRVLLDRGFVPERFRRARRGGGRLAITGNLHWPREFDQLFTPAPDGNLWFARRVPEMAAALGTEPVLIVAGKSDPQPDNLHPWPVAGAEIPNNHLQYAMTWFGLALVWSGMTAYWLWRIKRGHET